MFITTPKPANHHIPVIYQQSTHSLELPFHLTEPPSMYHSREPLSLSSIVASPALVSCNLSTKRLCAPLNTGHEFIKQKAMHHSPSSLKCVQQCAQLPVCALHVAAVLPRGSISNPICSLRVEIQPKRSEQLSLRLSDLGCQLVLDLIRISDSIR